MFFFKFFVTSIIRKVWGKSTFAWEYFYRVDTVKNNTSNRIILETKNIGLLCYTLSDDLKRGDKKIQHD